MQPLRKLAESISRYRSIPYKYRISAIKRLYPAMLKEFPFETDLLGLRFSGNLVNFIDRMIFLTGAHEKHMLFFMRDFILELRKARKADLIFMDIGANAGNHSLYLSTLVDKIYAFEPFDKVRKQFEDNISKNNIKNITVFPFGLSNENAELPFYAGPETNLGAASFVADHRNDNILLGKFQVRKGDEIVKKENLNPITLLKADVEGFEKNVLEGLKETIKRNRPLMIIEMSQTTLASFDNNKEKIISSFPDNYSFFYFSYGNYNSGRYNISEYDFKFHYKHQDMIACPQELVSFLKR